MVRSTMKSKPTWTLSKSAIYLNLIDIPRPSDFSYPRGLYANRLDQYIRRTQGPSGRYICQKETRDRLVREQKYPMIDGWAMSHSGELFLQVKEHWTGPTVYYRQRN